MSNISINTAYQQSFHCGLLFFDVDECLLTVLRQCKKFFHLELRSFPDSLCGSGQCLSHLEGNFHHKKSLQTSQLQVSPVDPIGIHLLLKVFSCLVVLSWRIKSSKFDFGSKPHHGCCPMWNCLSSDSQHLKCLLCSLWMVFSDLFCT